jgi:hypothetical protein
MRVFPAIVANLVLLLAALGFGSVLRRLFPQSFSQIDRLALVLLGGLGLLGIVLFCVGQVWFTRSAIILVLLLGVLLGLNSFVSVAGKYRAILAGISLPALPVMVIVTVLIVTAIGGLAEPTGDMNNDTIAYHYLGPKVWLREAVIRPVPDEILTSFPVLVETQYAALMSLGGQRAPEFFAVIGLISILLMAASLAIRLGLGPAGAWWTAALIVTMPAVYRGAYGGFIDVLCAGFILAAARLAFDAERPKDYVLFGVFCGIAMGTKYTNLIAWVLLLFCSFLISLWVHHRSSRVVLKCLAISCGIAIAVASPFYLRNWILFGCPIYPPPPVLLRIFAVKDMLPSVMQELQKNVLETGVGMGRSVWNFLLLPFNLTYHTADFRGAGGIGLAPLALGPLGLLACRRNGFARGLLLFALLQLAAWFATAQVSRYLIPVYVLAAVFAVAGWQYVARLASRYGPALSGVAVACSIAYGLVMILPARVDDLHAAVSSYFEAQRRRAEIPFIESLDYLNANPSVSKILILDPHVAAYFLDKTYIKPIGRWGEQTLPDATDLQKILSQLPGLHVSHVLIVRRDAGPFVLPEHLPGLTLVFQRNNQRVYRVD